MQDKSSFFVTKFLPKSLWASRSFWNSYQKLLYTSHLDKILSSKYFHFLNVLYFLFCISRQKPFLTIMLNSLYNDKDIFLKPRIIALQCKSDISTPIFYKKSLLFMSSSNFFRCTLHFINTIPFKINHPVHNICTWWFSELATL